ncbi:delta subunit of the central stalk of mitochondrial F1F0 ATP synthase, atp16 [Aspergillus melleus]|uniref:Delta subunit of the central stalk of mitochondrial F1F0 ATP synthase, atp16 n=1 Tax=Aspergillus melleus TaxID=138277 RepID=A0ACC3AQD8_9EURO|nr:delta subunit of the central stalk of mitochondrial F1F0 ATP synthase, atp16 [Aspergillus melleus]
MSKGYHHHLLPSIHCKMSSLRFARSAFRARPSAFRIPLQRRGYAEAVSDKIKLSLTLPHQVCFRGHPFSSLLCALFLDAND